jgi:hypothetical protein
MIEERPQMRRAAESDRRVKLSGVVRVPVELPGALSLFTPLGERVWAHGWDPQLLDPCDDDSQPGNVFEVPHGGVRSVWMVCRCEPGQLIQYARVVPGRTAGTIMVTLAPSRSGSVARVDYDLTALTDVGVAEINEFAEGYQRYLAEWEVAIAQACAAPKPTGHGR